MKNAPRGGGRGLYGLYKDMPQDRAWLLATVHNSTQCCVPYRVLKKMLLSYIEYVLKILNRVKNPLGGIWLVHKKPRLFTTYIGKLVDSQLGQKWCAKLLNENSG